MSLTAGEALRKAVVVLGHAGVDQPKLDARLLLAEVVGWAPQILAAHSDFGLSDDQAAHFDLLIRRRAVREPVCQILGSRGFWTLDLKVSGDTLAPRPDSEAVIEAVLAGLPDRAYPWRILDLGTGTGCLLLALLSELPQAQGVGVDLSDAALMVADANIRATGMEGRARLLKSEWGRAVADGAFDIVVSNPPYIPDDEIDGLEPEVALWEPRLALAGGGDGLDCYRALVPDLPRLLGPGGFAVLEVGQGQAARVAVMGLESGLAVRDVRRDLAGVERCVVLAKIA